MSAALDAGAIAPVILVMLTFRSSTRYVWSGVGILAYNGNNYFGAGSLGEMGTVQEGIDVKASGTTLTLSGIDATFMAECATDIQLGAPAKIWFGLFANGSIIGTPYLLYSGTVDKPKITLGGEKMSITLALENKMINLQRASNRRYTSADQRLQYPTDTAFSWVEMLNDQALKWGQA